MNSWFRAIALAIGTSVVVCASARTSAGACDNSRVEQLYNGELGIELRVDWRITRTAPLDGFFYKIEDRSGQLFFIDLGNNASIDVGPGKQATEVTINGSPATEFTKQGIVTDIILRPRCGGFLYVWLHVIGKDPAVTDRIVLALRSVKCLVAPRPARTVSPVRPLAPR